jgi:lipid-A-disaccharide synthase
MTDPAPKRPLRILVVAGEVSGDAYGAALMRHLRSASPQPLVFRGIGGDAMRAEGLELLCHCDRTAVIGFWEVLRQGRFFIRLLRQMTGEIAVWKPGLLLTIDYPGFNLRLAARAHARGIRTVHYICPQVWIWHKRRVHTIARIIDQLITIFPFEPACFDKTPLRPLYAGHPLVDQAQETLARSEQPLPWAEGRRVALLPGSRDPEIRALLPVLVAAAAQLDAQAGACSFLIPAASARTRASIETELARCPERPPRIQIVDGQAREVLRQAEAAAIASGTATLEASLMRCPALLVYRISWLSYPIFRWLLRDIGYVGLANIIAGRDVMPELLQQALTPEAVARQLQIYLTQPAARAAALADLDDVNARLGGGGSLAAAARAILREWPALVNP